MSSSAAASTPRDRDQALDVIRGLAIVMMVGTHVAPTTKLTAILHLPIWVGAADVFVLGSGFVLGMRAARRQGPARIELYRWLVKRAFMLLRVHYALTLAVLVVHEATGRLEAPSVADAGGWLQALGLVLTLRLQPDDLMNILPLYVCFLAAAPLVLEASNRGRSALALAVSFVVWAVAQTHPNLVPLPDPRFGEVSFSLSAWQFVFVVGLLAGFHRAEIAALSARHRSALTLAVCGSATALFVAAQLQRGPFAGLGLTLPPEAEPWLAKETWAPGRATYALTLVVACYLALARWDARAPARRKSALSAWLDGALATLRLFGRKSLYCFQLHLVVALGFSALGSHGWPGWSQELLVVAVLLLLYECTRRELWLSYLPA